MCLGLLFFMIVLIALHNPPSPGTEHHNPPSPFKGGGMIILSLCSVPNTYEICRNKM